MVPPTTGAGAGMPTGANMCRSRYTGSKDAVFDADRRGLLHALRHIGGNAGE